MNPSEETLTADDQTLVSEISSENKKNSPLNYSGVTEVLFGHMLLRLWWRRRDAALIFFSRPRLLLGQRCSSPRRFVTDS